MRRAERAVEVDKAHGGQEALVEAQTVPRDVGHLVRGDAQSEGDQAQGIWAVGNNLRYCFGILLNGRLN